MKMPLALKPRAGSLQPLERCRFSLSPLQLQRFRASETIPMLELHRLLPPSVASVLRVHLGAAAEARADGDLALAIQHEIDAARALRAVRAAQREGRS
jgi:hypothetical protein